MVELYSINYSSRKEPADKENSTHTAVSRLLHILCIYSRLKRMLYVYKIEMFKIVRILKTIAHVLCGFI